MGEYPGLCVRSMHAVPTQCTRSAHTVQQLGLSCLQLGTPFIVGNLILSSGVGTPQCPSAALYSFPDFFHTDWVHKEDPPPRPLPSTALPRALPILYSVMCGPRFDSHGDQHRLGDLKIALCGGGGGGVTWTPAEGGGGGSRNGVPCRALCFV